MKYLLGFLCLFSLGFCVLVKNPVECKKVPFEGVYKEIVDQNRSDSPVISAFSFRAIADHHLDNNLIEFETDLVQTGDIIYLCHDYLKWFATKVHPYIKHPYILYTGDTGDYVPQQFTLNLLYDPKLAAWYSRSMMITNHKKFVHVPMGPTDLFFAQFWGDNLKEAFLEEMRVKRDKKHLVYLGFCPREHGNRHDIAKTMVSKGFCYSHMHFCEPGEHFNGIKWDSIPTREYYKVLNESKFVVSPLGLEVDCVRNWEAIALNCIPLMPRTFADPMYYDLPVVFVDDWEALDETYLEKKYQEIHAKSWNLAKISFPYWEQKIRQAQNEVREQGLNYATLEQTLFPQEEKLEIRQHFQRSKNRHLLMIGFLTGLRSYQMTKILKSKKMVLVQDPYNTKRMCAKIEEFAKDKAWKRYRPRTYSKSPIQFRGDIFLDLTHYRSRLSPGHKDWRSTLEKELTEISQSLRKGEIIVGNAIDDPYVQHVLDAIQNKLPVSIERKNRTWKITK